MAEIPNYPIAVVAKLLDLSERHVRRLADDNILKKPEKNKGWEITNVTLYIRYLRERAFGKDISTTDLHNEKLRLTKAQADKATLEVNELEGELIPAQLVEDTWINYTANVRAKLLGLPSRIAHEVITVDDYQKALIILKEQVHEALSELGEDGIPEKYRKRNRQRKQKLVATKKSKD
jgi:phage terminase Nu1 subunit (DNA packaging protein)